MRKAMVRVMQKLVDEHTDNRAPKDPKVGAAEPGETVEDVASEHCRPHGNTHGDERAG